MVALGHQRAENGSAAMIMHVGDHFFERLFLLQTIVGAQLRSELAYAPLCRLCISVGDNAASRARIGSSIA